MAWFVTLMITGAIAWPLVAAGNLARGPRRTDLVRYPSRLSWRVQAVLNVIVLTVLLVWVIALAMILD